MWTLLIFQVLITTICALPMLKCYAAEKNKFSIGEVLQDLVVRRSDAKTLVNVFEVASGTGEHAAHFNSIINQLYYQPSDPNPEMRESIEAWTAEYVERVLPPMQFDILEYNKVHLPERMQKDKVDIIICINMIHISPFECTTSLFRFADAVLNEEGVVLTYGPYRVGGTMTESNVQFDESLKARHPEWGIRDIEAVEEAALAAGLMLQETRSMPANNLCLVFGREPKIEA